MTGALAGDTNQRPGGRRLAPVTAATKADLVEVRPGAIGWRAERGCYRIH